MSKKLSRFKRLAAAASAACMLLCAAAPSLCFADNGKTDEIYSYIDFNGSNTHGLSFSGSEEYREYGGKRGIYISDTAGNKRLDFDISGTFPSKSAAEITVEYYDLGTGYFTITYDSGAGALDAEPVIVENTGTWREYTFYIYDAKMSNGYNGNDFSINLNSSKYGQSRCALTVGNIEMKTGAPRGIEADAYSERAGNIFVEGDDVKLSVELKSTVFEKQSADVEYRLINRKSGAVVWSGTDSAEIGAKAAVTKNITPEFDEYGLFILEIECTSEKYHSVSREKLSYSVRCDEPNDTIGTAVHFTERDSGAVAPLIAANGIAYIRDGFLWEDYERRRGVFSFLPEWERYLSDVEKAGLEPLIILGFSNPNYHSGAICVPKTEEELEAFGNYVYKLVSFLGDRCMMYEVWNEPNLQTFSSDQTPEAYFPVLKVAYENVKKANPDALVMGCATAGIDPDWHRTVFEMGGADYMDILSFHFYYLDKKVMNPSVNLYERLKEVDELCEEYNPELKMAITEYGWAVNVYPTSPQMHLEDFLKTEAIFKRIPRIEYSFWYEYQDSGISMYDKERNFGLVEYWERETPYAAKPLYIGASMYNKVIGNTPLEDYIESDGAYIYRFGENSSGKASLMMWAENTSKYVSLELGCESVTVYDTYGNGKTLYGLDGVFTFMLEDTPVIVEGDILKCEPCEPVLKLTDNGSISALSGEEHTLSVGTPDNVSVSFTPSDGITITEQSKAGIKYTTDADPGSVGKISIKAESGGKTYFEGAAAVTVVPKAEGTILSLPYLDVFGRTVMCVSVKNNSSEKSISGTVKLTAPSVFTSKLSDAEFSDIKPGASQKCYIYLPSFSRGGHYDMSALVKTDDGESFEVSSAYDRSYAAYTSTPPEIDGVMSDGEYDDEYAMQTVAENTVNLFEGANSGEQDLSAVFYVSFDDENFYIAAEVTDDVHYQVEDEANMWRGDGIQFGLCDSSVSPVISSEIGVSLRGSKVQTTGYTNTEQPMRAAVKRTGTKTVYEVAVPIEGVFGSGWELDGKDKIGFSILANDNDGPDARSTQSGRKGWVEYGSGIGSSKNTSLYAELKLTR